jgi:hypothetical protein
MIGQYLPNNNETVTVSFRQNFCQLNSLLEREIGASCQVAFNDTSRVRAPGNKAWGNKQECKIYS